MGVRGRHGVAELAVIGPSGIETVRRPEPPDELTDEQATEWRAIVNRLGADWFPRETHPMSGCSASSGGLSAVISMPAPASFSAMRPAMRVGRRRRRDMTMPPYAADAARLPYPKTGSTPRSLRAWPQDRDPQARTPARRLRSRR
jgi:hypothetical protein